MRLSFLGAVTGVTGSQFLVETARARVLVDCGMFQGSPHEMVHNRFDFAFDAGSIDAVVLTHAHLDHCGLLPRLVQAGYRGSIHATAGTVELAALVLRDSGKLQKEAARDHARWKRKHPDEAVDQARAMAPIMAAAAEGSDPEETIRGQPAQVVVAWDDPIYTPADVEQTIPRLRVLEYDTPATIAPGVRATLLDAGHILGSAIVRLEVTDDASGATRTIVFSGDLGRPDTPILRDPTPVAAADYVVCESTYGGQEHPPTAEAVRMLADVVSEVAQHDGVLLVPAFAIGRTQELVWELDRLLAEGRVPALQLFLDSPMATKATDVYRHHPAYFDAETAALLAGGQEPLDYPNTTVTRKGDESRAIETSGRPFMVVASSGMLTGGRILNHVRALIDDPKTTILFVGYQGAGTLGAHLQAGATTVRIDGADRPVRCLIRSIQGFSAHADDRELVGWLGGFSQGRRPRRTFLVHGDPAPRAALAASVGHTLGYPIELPGWRETVELE